MSGGGDSLYGGPALEPGGSIGATKGPASLRRENLFP